MSSKSKKNSPTYSVKTDASLKNSSPAETVRTELSLRDKLDSLSSKSSFNTTSAKKSSNKSKKNLDGIRMARNSFFLKIKKNR